jgi:hypothetical protein
MNDGSHTLNPKRRCFNLFDAETYNGVMLALSFFFILLTLVVVGINTITAPARDSLFRVGGIATADQVVGGSGESGARYAYLITFDWNDDSISYIIQRMENTTTDITGVYLMGPIPPLSNVAPLAGALCGAPTLACDTLTTPGIVDDTVSASILDGIHPSGVDIRPLVEAYRAAPHRYYLELRTNGVPLTPGAARGTLSQFAGFP